MTTQKITIMGEYPKVEWREVPATVVEIHPKWTFFVHRTVEKTGPAWAVSEKSTGSVVTHGRTKADAIAQAKGKVSEVGEKGMDIAITSRLEWLKKYEDMVVATCPVCDKPYKNGTCAECDKLVAAL